MTRMQRFGYQVREDVAKEGLVFGRMLDNKEQMQMEYMRHECMDIVAANDAEHIEIKQKAAKVSDLEDELSDAEYERDIAKDDNKKLQKMLKEENAKNKL